MNAKEFLKNINRTSNSLAEGIVFKVFIAVRDDAMLTESQQSVVCNAIDDAAFRLNELVERLPGAPLSTSKTLEALFIATYINSC